MSEKNYAFIHCSLKEKIICGSGKATRLPNSGVQTCGDESPINAVWDTVPWFPVLKGAREAGGFQ